MKHERDSVKDVTLPIDRPIAHRITTMNTPSASAYFWANLPELGWDSYAFCVFLHHIPAAAAS